MSSSDFAKSNGMQFDFALRPLPFGLFVDAAFWQDVLPGYEGPTEAYTLVDGGFGVHSTDRTMTVAVRGTNLLNKPVQQHVFGHVIRRTVTGEVRFEF